MFRLQHRTTFNGFYIEKKQLPWIKVFSCHADRNENPEIKQMWEHIAKKYNGLGLKAISMTCTGLALMAATPNKVPALSIPDRNVLFSPH